MLPADERGGSLRATNYKGQQEGISGDDGHAHYLKCGDGSMGLYLCQTYQVVQLKYKQLAIYQLYLNKTRRRKRRRGWGKGKRRSRKLDPQHNTHTLVLTEYKIVIWPLGQPLEPPNSGFHVIRTPKLPAIYSAFFYSIPCFWLVPGTSIQR